MKKSFPFTLVLSGFTKLSSDVEDALYGGRCDDALLSVRAGVPYLDFDREASSFQDAVLSAVRDVEQALPRARVLRVEPDDFVTASEIGRRVNRTRESIRQLASGARGPGGFPAPASSLVQKSPLWRWAEVVDWFVVHQMVSAEAAGEAGIVAACNAALELRRHEGLRDALLSTIVQGGRSARASGGKHAVAEECTDGYGTRGESLLSR